MGGCTECGFPKDGSSPSRLPDTVGWTSNLLNLFDLGIGWEALLVVGLIVSVLGFVLSG